MSISKTTVAERNRIVDLKLEGFTLNEIAEQTGWSFECVRKWWRRFQKEGRRALKGKRPGKPANGPMSSFPCSVRFVCLRLKKQHPGWGADVVRLRLAQRLDLAEADLPCSSTIEKYWMQFRDRLYERHRKRHSTTKTEADFIPTEPHERWQADFKEQMRIPGLKQKMDILNIRDEATPVKIGSEVFPAGKCTGRDMQEAFRKAFERWGLCDRLKTDRDKRVLNNNHPHPFPTPFALWLAGLGIAHDLARSAQDNGCIERDNRTWWERVILGRTIQTCEELQQISAEEQDWINERLPSKGRGCAGQPPLTAYPQARIPRRAYTREKELELFSLPRVHEFLSGQFWWRRVSEIGQITISGKQYGVGKSWRGQDVRITFNAQQVLFLVEDDQEQIIKTLEPKNLTAPYITGLKPDPSA